MTAAYKELISEYSVLYREPVEHGTGEGGCFFCKDVAVDVK
ncbi:hypothetical protein QG37_01614 [Candidozyma auris]|nr:hypothetical protein QG37_01614 [[Candida] auris]